LRKFTESILLLGSWRLLALGGRNETKFSVISAIIVAFIGKLVVENMGDNDSNFSTLFSSRSVPLLKEEDDDSQDEIVLFDEDDEFDSNIIEEDYSDYDDLIKNRKQCNRMVTFVHSSKNSKGNFFTERKTCTECIENGCEEAEPGVFAPLWYFTYLFGEIQGKKAWSEAVNSRRVKDRGGKAIKISNDAFRSVVSERERGNRCFQRDQYNSALESYLKSESLVGIPGIYLIPDQRDELVKILSNQAECYLRMMKYEEARDAANDALLLDKKHLKSILRRAKAIYYGAKRTKTITLDTVAQATEDLALIVEEKGRGAEEAEALMDLIMRNVIKAQ
jgi:tetratricopeptide (TPR) repeat protein